MSKSYGIDQSVFRKKFKATGNYVTNDGVIDLLDSRFPSLTGTVQRIYHGTGLSIAGGSSFITKEGTINLNAKTTDLLDVSPTPPNSAGDVLSWDAVSEKWKATNPQILTGGASPRIISISDLSNVNQNTNISRNNLLVTNNGSSTVSFTENTYIHKDNYLHGQGIAPFQLGQDLSKFYNIRIQTDLASIPLSYNGEDASALVVTDSSLEQKRVPTEVIDLTQFSNEGTSPYINWISFTGAAASNNPFSFISNGPSVMIGVCLSKFNTINLSNTGPSPGVFGILRIVNGGTSAGTSEGARTNLGLSWNTDVMKCTGPIFNGWMTGDNISLSGAGTSSTYINFNSSVTGSGGKGIRYNGVSGKMQFSHDGLSWNTINGMSVGDLANVNIATPSLGDLLIYTGTCFSNTGLYGNLTIDYLGNAQITGEIPSTIIQTDTTSVTQYEFSCLTGISSKIQTQLDNRVRYTTTPNQGDLLYYNNPAPGISTVDTIPIGGIGDILYVKGTNDVGWGKIGDDNGPNSIFGISTVFDTVAVFSTGTSAGYRINKENFINQIAGTSGITSNNGPSMRINISTIGPSSLISTTQLDNYNMYIEERISTNQNIITLDNLAKSIIKPQAGLCYTPNEGIGTKLYEWANPLAVGAAGYTPERLELAYFSNYFGVSYIGVYDGPVSNNWYGSSLVNLF